MKDIATHSSVLAWRIAWTEEPGGLQSMGSQGVRHRERTEEEEEEEGLARSPSSALPLGLYRRGVPVGGGAGV